MSNAVVESTAVSLRRRVALARPGGRPTQPRTCSRVVRDDASTVKRSACVVQRPRRSLWMRLKMIAFTILTTFGFLVAAPQLLAMIGPNPAVDPVPGDPASAHVLND